MPKELVRVLRAEGLWTTELEREQLRRRLNDLGFYVLTNGDQLEVYVVGK